MHARELPARRPTSSGPRYKGRPVDLVIDVRSKLEYWLGHLEHATCIPVDVIGDALPRRGDVGTDASILVYCASGGRSAAPAAALRALGYRNVTDGGAMTAAARDFTS